MNSLLLHIDEIRNLTKDLGTHILVINETKLDKNVHDDLVGISGFSIERRDRNRNGGGVALYIKDSLMDTCTVRNDLPNSSLESLCVEIKPAHSAPFLVLAWYRPPRASGEIFDQLEKTLEFLDKEGKEIILLGDTNCDILSNYPTVPLDRSPNLSPHSNRLLDIYNLFGLQQLIETATRETASSSILIDHVATNDKSNIVISGVHPLGLSDHYLVYCIRKFHGSSKKQHKISLREV